MESKEKIEVTGGFIELRKPKAKERNDAAIASYEVHAVRNEENKLVPIGMVNEARMLVLILPKCVASHSFGAAKADAILENLEPAEYDKVAEVMRKWLSPVPSSPAAAVPGGEETAKK